MIKDRTVNNQSPITKLQLITNTQYSITKQKPPGIVSRLGIRALVIGYCNMLRGTKML